MVLCCVSSRKRICEFLEYSKHYLIKILWRNEQLFSQFCINKLSCLDTSLQYLYRSLSFFELGSNSMASWLILSQFSSLTLWPNRLNYFQVLNKPWVVQTITHVFLTFCRLCRSSRDHQTVVLPVRHTRVMTHSVSGTLCWTMWIWLLWAVVCPSDCMSTWGLMTQFVQLCVCSQLYPSYSVWLIVW